MNKRGLEARDNWVAARIDELMDDWDWLDAVADDWYENAENETLDSFAADYAKRTAEREHASLMADLEEALIDDAREY